MHNTPLAQKCHVGMSTCNLWSIIVTDQHTAALRPETLDQFTGQDAAVRQLNVVLDAAQQRGTLPDHVLLHGPPGLGKTTLAHIIANEVEAEIVVTSGPALEKPSMLAGILAQMSGPTVVFVDEIHRLPKTVEETLHPALEDYKLDIVVGEGVQAQTIRIDLEKFTLVGATTQAGLLSNPFRDRFGFKVRLRPYDQQAITTIVQRANGLLNSDLADDSHTVNLADDAASAIADRSRGTPRVALGLLRRVRDYAQHQQTNDVGRDVAAAAFDVFDIDNIGLDAIGQDLLRMLCVQFGGGPVGLNTLAAALDESATTIAEVYEPYLLRQGLIKRTQRGRMATTNAYGHLGLDVPASVLVAGQHEADSNADGQLSFDEAS